MRITNLLTAFVAHWQAARARRVATSELVAMSGCELGDIGITRLDVNRLFEPHLASEFRSRGGVGRVAAATTFKPLSQRPAVMTSLEALS
jgi:uncharacterized protein YjiS (DUF1127 family)